MWERTLSQKSVRLFCEQKVIDEAKADAYVYGYELLISSVVSILLVILIAAVCGDVRYSLSLDTHDRVKKSAVFFYTHFQERRS